MVVVAAKVASLDVGVVGGNRVAVSAVFLLLVTLVWVWVGLSLILLWFRPWFWLFFACLSVSKSLEI